MNQSKLPSNRSFGALFVSVFGLACAYGWWKDYSWHPWAGGASVACLLVTVAVPGLLTLFNRLWMALAFLLHRVVSPLVLGAMYFGVFAPIGIVMRWSGRDVLKGSYDPELQTYWSDRPPPGPTADDLRNQF